MEIVQTVFGEEGEVIRRTCVLCGKVGTAVMAVADKDDPRPRSKDNSGWTTLCKAHRGTCDQLASGTYVVPEAFA